MIDKDTLKSVSYGLYVLIARHGDQDNGCIINVAQQVTSDPLQLMICVNKSNLTHEMIIKTAKFNLCPLSEDATMKPFQHFGFQSGREVNKFAQCEEELRSSNGLLYLPRFINACFSCVVSKAIDLGTHTMFIASVVESIKLSDTPSITYAYYQQNIKSQPSDKKEEEKSDNGAKRWVCEVCGYVYEGEEMPEDYVCPWCKHGKSDFKLME